jgi:hypothetical protein
MSSQKCMYIGMSQELYDRLLHRQLPGESVHALFVRFILYAIDNANRLTKIKVPGPHTKKLQVNIDYDDFDKLLILKKKIGADSVAELVRCAILKLSLPDLPPVEEPEDLQTALEEVGGDLGLVKIDEVRKALAHRCSNDTFRELLSDLYQAGKLHPSFNQGSPVYTLVDEERGKRKATHIYVQQEIGSITTTDLKRWTRTAAALRGVGKYVALPDGTQEQIQGVSTQVQSQPMAVTCYNVAVAYVVGCLDMSKIGDVSELTDRQKEIAACAFGGVYDSLGIKMHTVTQELNALQEGRKDAITLITKTDPMMVWLLVSPKKFKEMRENS